MGKQGAGPRGGGGGLRATPEDLQWLRLVELQSKEPLPAFNVSRLVALGLVQAIDGKLELTERGRGALAQQD